METNNMDLTSKEILKVKTGGSIKTMIIEGTDLYLSVISAMEYYAKQEVEKAIKGIEKSCNNCLFGDSSPCSKCENFSNHQWPKSCKQK